MKWRIGLLSVFLLAAGIAHASWLYTDLHPSWATNSIIYGVSAGDQVGQGMDSNFKTHALRWQFSPSTVIDLGGPGTSAWATDGTFQLGTKGPATRWQGTAASAIGLRKPAYSSTNMATTRSGPAYAGYAHMYPPRTLPTIRALYWPSLTSNPVVIPLPPGFTGSLIYAMDNDIRSGYVYYEDGISVSHAATWEGPSHTFQDRHPYGYLSSTIRGMSQEIAVGWASENEYVEGGHAAIWDLWGGGFWDVHPWEYYSSNFWAISGWTAAGQVMDWSGYRHAIVYDLSTGIVTDLHQFLPSYYSESSAFAIWTGSGCGGMQVGGYAYSTLDNKQHGMLWYTPWC